MLPAIIGAAGAIGSTVLGGVLNKSASQDANQLNYRNWIKMQEYNSPSKQKERLRAAGINPAMALQNGAMDSGNMSSQAPDASVPSYDFSPAAHGIVESSGLFQAKRLQDSQIRNQDAVTENQMIRNKTQLLRDIAEFSKMANDSAKSAEEREQFHWLAQMAKNEYEHWDETYGNQQSLVVAQKNAEQAHADYLQAQKEYQSILNQFEPQKQKLIVANLEKQGREIESAIRKNDAEAAHAAALKALTDAQKEGVDIDNDTKDSMADYIVDKAASEADEQYWKALQANKRFNYGTALENLPADDIRNYPERDWSAREHVRRYRSVRKK